MIGTSSRSEGTCRRSALRRELEGIGDGRLADAVQGGLPGVDHVADLGLRSLDVPVDVHDAGGAFHDLSHLAGEFDALGLVGAVDLGHDRLQNRRPGRNLRDGHGHAVFARDGGDGRPDPFRDVMALPGAELLADEVHLDVGDVRAAPQVVMAHETVEIERRRRARVHLVIAHFGFRADRGRHLAGDPRRLLERGAFGGIDDDLEFRLVVEREHLHLHAS